jgi:hypothetical protein
MLNPDGLSRGARRSRTYPSMGFRLAPAKVWLQIPERMLGADVARLTPRWAVTRLALTSRNQPAH